MLAVRQALVRHLDKAIAELKRRDPSDHAIHEVRKELKRARAALRLLRECIGVDAFQRENALMRDAARPLTALRDAKVLLAALRGLDSGTVATTRNAFARYLSRVLRQEQLSVRKQLRSKELIAAAAALRAVKRRLEAVPEIDVRQSALGPALERAYQSGRKAFTAVKRRPTDEGLHEWRKQTKYFSNQLEILLPLGSKRFAKSYKRSQSLAEYLGEDHDLALLSGKIFRYAKGPNAASRNDAVAELLAGVAGRRKALQRKAYRLGRRLYANKPRRIAEKIKKRVHAVPGERRSPPARRAQSPRTVRRSSSRE